MRTEPSQKIPLLERRIANYSRMLLGNPMDRQRLETEKQIAERELAKLLERQRQKGEQSQGAAQS